MFYHCGNHKAKALNVRLKHYLFLQMRKQIRAMLKNLPQIYRASEVQSWDSNSGLPQWLQICMIFKKKTLRKCLHFSYPFPLNSLL